MPGVNYNWGMFLRKNNNMQKETLEEIKAREQFVDNYLCSNFRSFLTVALLGISGLGSVVFGSMFPYRIISGDDRESIKMIYTIGAGCMVFGLYGAIFNQCSHENGLRKKWYKLKMQKDERDKLSLVDKTRNSSFS